MFLQGNRLCSFWNISLFCQDWYEFFYLEVILLRPCLYQVLKQWSTTQDKAIKLFFRSLLGNELLKLDGLLCSTFARSGKFGMSCSVGAVPRNKQSTEFQQTQHQNHRFMCSSACYLIKIYWLIKMVVATSGCEQNHYGEQNKNFRLMFKSMCLRGREVFPEVEHVRTV